MEFFAKVRRQYRVTAKFQDWKGRWIHYTDYPELKLHYEVFHQDPVGLYFFPEHFKPQGDWRYRKYKFVVQLKPEAKVLDWGTIDTPQKAMDFLRKIDAIPAPDAPGYEDWRRFEISIKETERVADTTWEWLARLHSLWGKQAGKFNQRFRRAGYDAIFDDSDSIFHGEVQLIVLDPAKVTVLERQDRKGSGFQYVASAFAVINDVLGEYEGEIAYAKKPLRQADTFSGYGKKEIFAEIKFDHGEIKHSYTDHEGKEKPYTTPLREVHFKMGLRSVHEAAGATTLEVWLEGDSPTERKAQEGQQWRNKYRDKFEVAFEDFQPERLASWVKRHMDYLWLDKPKKESA